MVTFFLGGGGAFTNIHHKNTKKNPTIFKFQKIKWKLCLQTGSLFTLQQGPNSWQAKTYTPLLIFCLKNEIGVQMIWQNASQCRQRHHAFLLSIHTHIYIYVSIVLSMIHFSHCLAPLLQRRMYKNDRGNNSMLMSQWNHKKGSVRQSCPRCDRNLFLPLFGRKHPSRDVIFSGQNLAKRMPKIISLHDVPEPLKQALLASRDVLQILAKFAARICKKFSH